MFLLCFNFFLLYNTTSIEIHFLMAATHKNDKKNKNKHAKTITFAAFLAFHFQLEKTQAQTCFLCVLV